MHVRDLAAAHLLALEATGEGDPSLEVYNLGSAAGFSVREVVEAARKVTGRGIPARVLKRRSGDRRCWSRRRAVPAGSGWQPQHSKLDEMLTDAWAWRMAHPNGYARPAATDGAAGLPAAVAAGDEESGQAAATRAGCSGGSRAPFRRLRLSPLPCPRAHSWRSARRSRAARRR